MTVLSNSRSPLLRSAPAPSFGFLSILSLPGDSTPGDLPGKASPASYWPAHTLQYRQTLLEKLKSMYSNLEGLPPDRIVPTVGLNIGRIEDSNSKLVFWDLGGQIGLRTIWEKYYEEAHSIIYVIDAACPSTFENSKSALEKVLRHEDLRGAPLLILANKQDLPGAVSSEELARYLDLKELDERPYMFEAVSAYDGKGIKFAIDWLVEVMERSKRTESLRIRAGVAGNL